MAALWDLPVVFICQNNMYAEMTPTADTMKLAHVADRASGYGMPGVCADDELNRIDEGALISVEDALKAVLSTEVHPCCRRARSPDLSVVGTHRRCRTTNAGQGGRPWVTSSFASRASR
jgi:hypothetical protein